MSLIITEKTHFTESELNCRCGCGLTLKPDFLFRIESFRRILGFSMPITSGARCPTYNKKVGGVKNSMHPKGLAIDVLCTDSYARYMIMKLALRFEFKGLGVGSNFLHIDDREGVSKCWTYPSSVKDSGTGLL